MTTEDLKVLDVIEDSLKRALDRIEKVRRWNETGVARDTGLDAILIDTPIFIAAMESNQLSERYKN